MFPQSDPDQILIMPPALDADDAPIVTQATILEDVFEPAVPAPTHPQEKGVALFSQEKEPTNPGKFGPVAREWGRRSVPPPPMPVAAEKIPVTPEMTPAAKPPAPQTKPAASYDKPAVAQERPAVMYERPAVTQTKPVAPRSRPAVMQEKKPVVMQEKKPVSQERAPKPERAQQAEKGRDRYSFGVQMLRLSPTWLVAGGLAFVSLIVLCTWLIKPAGQEEQSAAQRPARNQATNQRPADASKPAATAPDRPAAAPAREQQAAAKPEEQKPSGEQKPAEQKPAAESKPAEAAPPVAAAFKEDGKFTVQVGSFPDEAQARERVNHLKAAGFDGRAVAAQIPNRGTWYRVQAGRFADRGEAGRYASEMRSKGVAEGVMVTEVR